MLIAGNFNYNSCNFYVISSTIFYVKVKSPENSDKLLKNPEWKYIL